MDSAVASSSSGTDLSSKIETVFQRFDTKGDGFIDKDELKKVMQSLDSVMWTDRRISRLLHALDRNRDGRLQYKQFVHWACSVDTNPDLLAFRQALDISTDDAKAAASNLPAVVRRRPSRTLARSKSKPSSARTVPRAASVGKKPVRRKTSGDAAESAPLPCEESTDLVPVLDAPSTLPLGEQQTTSVDESVDVHEAMPADKLIIFDYDGTITIDKDEGCKGLRGQRLDRLKQMMAKIQAASTRCILVTAQFPHATQELTIPTLNKTGLAGLFDNETFNCRLRLYWDDVAQGTVYNGAKVMLGKMDLIEKIINGQNCWEKTFSPSNVLFIDDDIRNFRGNERVGIKVHHVGQDGMVSEDIEILEAFAEGRVAEVQASADG